MNKILLILGASSDIGLAYINKYHDNYDKILMHYHSNNQELKNIKKKLKGKAVSLQADFLSEEETIQFCNKISELGLMPTHILHIPASRIQWNKLSQLSWSDFENDMNIQLRSIFYIMQNILPIMVKNKEGKVVFMLSSCTVNQPPKNYIEYTTIKYAMLGFMKSLAVDYASKNIKINGISPSMIETKFLDNVPRLAIQQNAQNNPIGRNAITDDVIPMIDFLLSENANYITGQNMVVSIGQ